MVTTSEWLQETLQEPLDHIAQVVAAKREFTDDDEALYVDDIISALSDLSDLGTAVQALVYNQVEILEELAGEETNSDKEYQELFYFGLLINLWFSIPKADQKEIDKALDKLDNVFFSRYPQLPPDLTTIASHRPRNYFWQWLLYRP